MLIGIDPGTQNGVTIFENGNLLDCQTYSVLQLIEYLTDNSKLINTIVMEDSRMQSYVFTGSDKNRAESLKIARNIGQVDMICRIIEMIVNTTDNIDLICISPKAKGRKLNSEEFKQKTGWKSVSNSHERDAAMVAWRYRNMK